MKNNTKKDVFHAYLLKDAKYDGELEIPIINRIDFRPNMLKGIIPFSEISRTNNYDQWVCFYENDESFECFWNTPQKYLEKLKQFQGVITPDYSMYQDMPLWMQQYNLARNRTLGYWLQCNGIKIIVNVRWGDERTYDVATLGVPTNSIIAIGSVGCVKRNDCKDTYCQGLDYILQKLMPKYVIVYGSAPDEIFMMCRFFNAEILQFDSFKWRQREVLNG